MTRYSVKSHAAASRLRATRTFPRRTGNTFRGRNGLRPTPAGGLTAEDRRTRFKGSLHADSPKLPVDSGSETIPSQRRNDNHDGENSLWERRVFLDRRFDPQRLQLFKQRAAFELC